MLYLSSEILSDKTMPEALLVKPLRQGAISEFTGEYLLSIKESNELPE